MSSQANIPIFRRFTRLLPVALDAFLLATDDITALGFYTLAGTRDLLDIVNSPDPGALRYEIRLLKNGIDTGRSWFSDTLNPASAGRVAIGPVAIGAGNISFSVAQRLGALTAYSFVIKLSGV